MLAACASFLLLKFATSVVQIPASSAPHYSTVMSDDDTSARAAHASMNYTKDASKAMGPVPIYPTRIAQIALHNGLCSSASAPAKTNGSPCPLRLVLGARDRWAWGNPSGRLLACDAAPQMSRDPASYFDSLIQPMTRRPSRWRRRTEQAQSSR